MADQTCARCGSDKIIPNIPLTDKYGDMGGYTADLEVKIHGNPEAWFSKDTAVGRIVAFICGSCGHTELKTQGYMKLYAKYQKAMAQEAEPAAPQSPPAAGEGVGDDDTCMSCGQPMGAEETQCPGCGWTWQAAEQ